MKIGVCVPTRGLINYRTINSISLALSELSSRGIDVWFKTFWGNIPDTFNQAVLEALQSQTDLILFVEEDIEFTQRALFEILNEIIENDVVCVDYALANGSRCVTYRDGKIWWCGMGLTMIKTKSLLKFKDNPFSTDYSYIIEDEEKKLIRVKRPPTYGGHDIHFGIRCNDLGLKIKEVTSEKCTHIKVKETKGGFVNKGATIFKECELTKPARNLDGYVVEIDS